MDGKMYPGSASANEAQRCAITQARRDHGWGRNRIAKELGCSTHTVTSALRAAGL